MCDLVDLLSREFVEMNYKTIISDEQSIKNSYRFG